MDAAAPLDPRAERSRAAILAAAAALIEEEGYAAVTHQRVAQRAGVGRATVYRHWPQLDDLLFAAVATIEAPIFRPGPGTLREWLRGELVCAAELFESPIVQHLIATLVDRGGCDANVAGLREEFGQHADDQLASRLRDALADGELDEALDAEDLAARLLGPLLFRALLQSRPADDPFIDAVLHAALVAPGEP